MAVTRKYNARGQVREKRFRSGGTRRDENGTRLERSKTVIPHIGEGASTQRIIIWIVL